jgi:membrane protein DedA with SNARE-associated domain
MSKTGIEKSVRALWVVGIGVWCPTVALLGWHLGEAQTFAQASLNSTRLELVSGIGVLWSLAGAAWLAKLRKTRTT